MAEKPLKIVRIMDRLNVGGPAVHAVLTSEGLSSEKTGGRVDTLLVHGHVTDDEEEMSHLFEGRPGLRREVLPTLSRRISPIKDLRAFLSIFWILLRERPDVVHTHKSKAGALGRIAAWITRVPVRVHTFHGQVFEGYFSEGTSKNIVRVERFLSTLSHGVLAISPALREELERDYRIAHPGKLRVVPLGLDLEALARPKEKRRLQRELDLPEDAPAVGIVGRLVPIKNQALFLRAAAKIATRIPELQVFVVGGGELEGSLKALAKELGLNAHFTGSQSDMAEVYASLDAVALSSDNEGTPVVLIEALAAGVPVVATDVGGVADVLAGGAHGRLVPAGDEDALAEAITATVLDPPSPAAREAARAHVLTHYSAERLCSDLEALYRELLER